MYPDQRGGGVSDAPHASVLLEPVLDFLRPRAGVGFRALDCTVGAGGHSFGLLDRSSPDGRLVGLDADPYALELAVAALAPFQSRFSLLDRNFSELAELDLEPISTRRAAGYALRPALGTAHRRGAAQHLA